MNLYKQWTTAGLALGIVVGLAGCSTTGNNSTYEETSTSGTMLVNQVNTTTFSKPENNTVKKQTATKNTSGSSVSNISLATMSSKELATYAQKHGRPLPSAAKNVERLEPSKSEVFFGAPSVTTHTGSTYKASNYSAVDLWSGNIQNTAFRLQIDKSKENQGFIVDVWSGDEGCAIKLNKQPWIRNFTGSYVIFASPNPAQGNPMYAINLMVGKVVSNNSQNDEYIRLMSGIGMGGYPSGISGLPKAYGNFPNGKQSY